MKIKTSELTGAALDWAVAESSDANWRVRNGAVIVLTQVPCPDKRVGCLVAHFSGKVFAPSTDWAQGGPILSRERISRTIDHSGLWVAYWTDGYADGDEGKKWMQCYRSELVAGLRCYVASKLGDTVGVPEELL